MISGLHRLRHASNRWGPYRQYSFSERDGRILEAANEAHRPQASCGNRAAQLGTVHELPNGVELFTFGQALDAARDQAEKPHLLLGNGFSIACRPDCFRYGALLEQAAFEGTHQDVRSVFELLGTADFERVIETLRVSAALIERYAPDHPEIAEQLHDDAAAIRETLATTLATRHPDLPFALTDAEYATARTFLTNFGRIYTVNYDMLLYWAVMQDGDEDIPTDDGFRAADDQGADYVRWEPYRDFNTQRLFYLHGGLHLYDAGSEISKITWSRTGIPLVEQIREALATGRYPLIVTEGNSRNKETKILHNAYLNHALRSVAKLTKVLFIFGHSLAPSDEHIFRRITESRITHLFISLHGNPASNTNRQLINRASALAAARPQRRPLTLHFYDADSAQVW